MYSLTHSFHNRKHVATIRSATTWVSFEVTPDIVRLFECISHEKCGDAVVGNVRIYQDALIFETGINVTCNMQFKLGGPELINIAKRLLFVDSHINSFVETAPAGLDDEHLAGYIECNVCKSVAAYWEK